MPRVPGRPGRANVRRTYEKFDLELRPDVEVERTKIRRDQAYFDVPSESWPF